MKVLQYPKFQNFANWTNPYYSSMTPAHIEPRYAQEMSYRLCMRPAGLSPSSI
jgi:hypothetical protein